jgi:putative membrane protein
MQWLKAFHIIFVVTWFAGLFYLPRLFVYHAMAVDQMAKNTSSKIAKRREPVTVRVGDDQEFGV